MQSCGLKEKLTHGGFYGINTQMKTLGELYNINTFNQPGVEQAKNYTYALMGRAGYEGSAETLKEKMATV